MNKNNPNICNDCAYNGGAEKYTPKNFERGGIFNVGKVLTVNNKGWIEPLPGGGSGAVNDVKVNNVSVVTNKVANITLNKVAVGLGNVDNTSDLNKPISTATQTALNNKQDKLTTGNGIVLVNNEISTTTTYQTTAPTQAITDGGVHIVYLNAEPATKYDGYIYLIKE